MTQVRVFGEVLQQGLTACRKEKQQMPDYLPSADGDFQLWQQNFVTYAAGHMAELGLMATDLVDAAVAQTAWDTAYAANNSAQITARTAAQFKKDKRSSFEDCIRPLVRRLQASPDVSDDERRALGITVRDGTSTPTSVVGISSNRPLATVDTSQRLRHEIKFVDEATPTSRAKPSGAMGCEIWVKVGAAPADPSELTFVALDTASPYIAEYNGADAGKTAYYMLRWVNTRSEKGPWSETVAATITG
jgi:hypothetical protein